MHPRTKELLDHLDRHHATLHEALDSVPVERREIAPAEGAWSVANVLEHVGMVNASVARLLHKKLAAAREAGLASDPDTSSVLEEFDMKPLLNRDMKISAPEIVRPSCAMDAETASRRVDESHAALRTVLTDFDGLALGTVYHTHPVFGTRNFYEWFAITGGHTARHAAQIREIGERVSG